MVRDWTGFTCSTIELICPVGRILEFDMPRMVWLYLDKKCNKYFLMRTNEIRRKCKQLEFSEREVRAHFVIKRICLSTENVGWMTVDKDFSRRKYAQPIPDKSVALQIKRLTDYWPGYRFEAENVD